MKILFLLFLSLPAICYGFDDEAVVGVGSSIRLAFAGAGSIHVSNGKVLQAEDLGSSLRITGRKAGIAVVTSDRKTVLVNVLDALSFKTYQNLQKVLVDKKGLEISIKDGLPTISGKLLRVSDWIDLSEAARGGGRYIFAANPDQIIVGDVQAMIAKRISEAGLPQPDLQISPATIRLSLERSDLAVRFEKALKPFGFTVEKSAGSITLEPLVRVQILVTEINKSMERQLGIKWPSQASAQLVPRFQAPDSPLTISLDALEKSGAGRILASPNLLCRSGKEAQFLAGGEFPIKLAGRRDSAVIWKQYGVLLKIKPLADFSGRMSIALTTEVSTIDGSRSVDGLPGLLTNRIESHFDLKGSRTIALSGLIKQETHNSSDGLPGLSSIPILGSLFSSKAFREDRTELVVFVTPEIVTDPGAE